jgi:outer membrane protein assembly factor BamD
MNGLICPKLLTLPAFMNKGFRLFFIFSVVVIFAACSRKSVGTILKSKDVEYKLKMAEQYYANKKYSKASQIFEDLFPVLRNDPRFEDLYYKYAYCAFYMKDYLNAENLFKGFLDAFSKSQRAPEADFMHAYCFFKQSPKVELDQSPTEKAIGFMQAHINNYPESPKIEDARKIIGECYEKLEVKEFKSAELYFNIGAYRASAISFTNLLNHYPESKRTDEYKLMIIKSYYLFANMSVEGKQKERFEKVLEEYYDFVDRFPESKLTKDAEKYFNLSKNSLNAIKNEQTDKKS